LYAVTGHLEFYRAAEEAIAFETNVFSAQHGNWPDFRPTAPQPYMAAWCHGGPGIGLARLGGLPVLDTPAIRQDIEAALALTAQTLTDAHKHADHVCCGNLGRIEVLLAAGVNLARPELVAAAQRAAAQVVAYARRRGYHFSNALPHGLLAPGLFQGAAGIGYELLRLAFPQRLPVILLWEAPPCSGAPGKRESEKQEKSK
jgi:lantibiotic modifying enzyme